MMNVVGIGHKMKDDKWINDRIGMLIIEMSFLQDGDRDEDRIYCGDEDKCILLKEMLN